METDFSMCRTPRQGSHLHLTLAAHHHDPHSSHWLPIKACINYKSLHALAPPYLTDLLHPQHQAEILWRQSPLCRSPPPPLELSSRQIRNAASLDFFKKLFKHHLLTKAFGLTGSEIVLATVLHLQYLEDETQRQ
ncbi:unnamed protein product [Pleuronectes platessa]|uniref:Uncharacterized protein n=1 Tax=Pleuronectes platessa TaxID=8262 RepID=A0A9N7VFL5_PLEPL|nr:unnamed protein product [Pleuronectes platessa]